MRNIKLTSSSTNVGIPHSCTSLNSAGLLDVPLDNDGTTSYEFLSLILFVAEEGHIPGPVVLMTKSVTSKMPCDPVSPNRKMGLGLA